MIHTQFKIVNKNQRIEIPNARHGANDKIRKQIQNLGYQIEDRQVGFRIKTLKD